MSGIGVGEDTPNHSGGVVQDEPRLGLRQILDERLDYGEGEQEEYERSRSIEYELFLKSELNMNVNPSTAAR